MLHNPLLAGFLLAATAVSTAPASDTFVINVAPELAGDVRPGRLILCFITQNGWRWDNTEPLSAPFLSLPQPIASCELVTLTPDAPLTVTTRDLITSTDIDDLDGYTRIQAVLDTDVTERSHDNGPGNLYSAVVATRMSADADDIIEITLDQRIEPRGLPDDDERIRWVEFNSPLLSAYYDRPVAHRAGVILPKEWSAESDRQWPAIYIIPGYGGTHLGARRYGRMTDGDLPAVRIVLDPDSPLGHHGFVDSPNHGPRGRSLVSEFIPHLEESFSLMTKPQGRIVTGHSSGGWSSLWLQLQHPDIFGACWSSAPDPVDFTHFQVANLYEDDNLYFDDDGNPVPSMRRMSRDATERVALTVQQEARMEWAIHPAGGSGQQWDAWEAMFSPRSLETGLPVPMFDAVTGAIDRDVVEHWKRFDITRMVTNDWEHFGPIIMQRVHLMCGTKDSYFLNRAVARFKNEVESLAAQHGGWSGAGYVELVEGADHGSIFMHTRQRWQREMSDFLAAPEATP